jgi:hypothetical protein
LTVCHVLWDKKEILATAKGTVATDRKEGRKVMGFIIEVILTVTAWRKGWGWKALIPMFLTFCAAFGGGFVLGLMGGSFMDYWPAFILLDVFCIIALACMIAKPVGMRKLPSYNEIKNLDQETTPKRAISSYGG